MARQLDPNGQSLYARFSRYLSEGTTGWIRT